jgi:hypothetical protein
MPAVIRQRLEGFVAEHGLDRAFVKRQRERPQLEALARGKGRRGESQ